MGFLSNLFGSKKTQVPDGLWLKNYKKSNWIEAMSLGDEDWNQTFYIASDSCYFSNGNCFCILRITETNLDAYDYICAFIPKDSNDVLVILVDRQESRTGETIKSDDWSKGRILCEDDIEGVLNASRLIKNIAGINNFSTVPPYVAIALMGS